MKTVKAAIYYCLLILFFRHYLLIKYQKHMISFNHDSNPMMYNCHPNFTNEKLRPWGWSMLPTSPQAYAGPPEPQPPLTCLSPEPVLWTIQETKEETMAPLPASTVSMSDYWAFHVFASFCLFTKTSPKWQESSCRLTYHFLSPNHVWVMVVTLLVYTITCKSWKQPYSVRVSLSYMREKEPAENTCPQVAFLESQMLYVAEPEMGPRSTVSKSQLLYDREWNEITFDGTTQSGTTSASGPGRPSAYSYEQGDGFNI